MMGLKRYALSVPSMGALRVATQQRSYGNTLYPLHHLLHTHRRNPGVESAKKIVSSILHGDKGSQSEDSFAAGGVKTTHSKLLAKGKYVHELSSMRFLGRLSRLWSANLTICSPQRQTRSNG